MLARYCLVALAALSVIVEAGGSRGRNVNIRSSNRFAPSRKSYNSNNRLNVNSRSSKLSNKRQVTIKPKKLSFSNKQRFASQSNSKRSHTNSNTGLQNNNFAKSIVSPVKNFNRINAHNYAKVEDNDQDSHQTVKSGTLNINGNLQFNSEDGIIPSATASPQSIAALSAPGGAAPALEDTATPEGDGTEE